MHARISMLVAILSLAGSAPRVARGAVPAPPIAISLVEPGACFDASALASEIRREMPGAQVSLGAAGDGSVSVTVRVQKDALDVEVARRATPDSVVRAEHRVLPAGAACAALVETVAAIAVRAVTPLGDLKLPDPPQRERPRPHVTVIVGPVVVTYAPPRPPPPPLPYLQLFAAARVNVSLDGAPVGVGGIFGFDVRIRHVLILAGGGVDSPLYYSTPTAGLILRRTPLFAGLGYDVDIPRGALRFSVAALVDLWTGAFDDPAGMRSVTVAHAGIQGSAAYHFRPVRLLDLFAGVDVEAAFASDTFTSAEKTIAAVTPSFWLTPRLGAAINFF